MKKITLIILMVGFALTAKAQFSLGVNIGLPMLEASDITSVSMNVDAAYMFEVSEKIDFGITTSYSYYSGEDPFPNWSFLPIAGAARYHLGGDFSLGTDLGYAIGLDPNGNDGGFYYRPMVGYDFRENITLTLSFAGVSVNGGNVANIGVGIMYGL